MFTLLSVTTGLKLNEHSKKLNDVLSDFKSRGLKMNKFEIGKRRYGDYVLMKDRLFETPGINHTTFLEYTFIDTLKLLYSGTPVWMKI